MSQYVFKKAISTNWSLLSIKPVKLSRSSVEVAKLIQDLHEAQWTYSFQEELYRSRSDCEAAGWRTQTRDFTTDRKQMCPVKQNRAMWESEVTLQITQTLLKWNICTHTHIHMPICIHSEKYAHKHHLSTYTCVYMLMPICTHICPYVYTSAHMHMCTHIWMCAVTCMHTYDHMHTLIHTYTPIYAHIKKVLNQNLMLRLWGNLCKLHIY